MPPTGMPMPVTKIIDQFTGLEGWRPVRYDDIVPGKELRLLAIKNDCTIAHHVGGKKNPQFPIIKARIISVNSLTGLVKYEAAIGGQIKTYQDTLKEMASDIKIISPLSPYRLCIYLVR